MNTDLDLLLRIEEMKSSDTAVSRSRRAEELGYCRVSMGETTAWNVIALLTRIAEGTETIGLSTDVVSPYGRSAAMLAQTAVTINEISAGRLRLGLGPSSPAITENWHGVAFDRPLRRLRETIEVIRTIYESDAPTYDGEIIDIERGLDIGIDIPESPPPLDVACLGPKATELAGRFADGWIPQLFTAEGLAERLADLERGTDLANRDLSDIRVSPVYRCFASEDREHARETARSAIAFQIGAYGPYYGDSVGDQGYPNVVTEIREAWGDRDTDAMAAALPGKWLDELVAVGTPDEVRDRVERYADIDEVSAIRIGFLNGMSEEEKNTTLNVVSKLI